jgi:hypothetical protein
VDCPRVVCQEARRRTGSQLSSVLGARRYRVSVRTLPFYAGHGVGELLIVDPHERAVHWLGLTEGRYLPLARSWLVNLGPDELAARIDWPTLDG